MPFTYSLPVPQLAAEVLDGGQARLVRFLAEERGWVEAGAAVAELESSSAMIQVTANGPGVLTRRVTPAGAMVRPGDVLATIQADGESVPYDKPLSLAQVQRKTG
jgi:pyruvate/2-oxoglutarate dehydrogenase complex dihydrolipoamide acyltransferase (E2) component